MRWASLASQGCLPASLPLSILRRCVPLDRSSSGVEKLTRSSSKGAFQQGPFCLQKWAFCKQLSPLRYRTFISLGKFVFQKSLSETPFKPDQVSFCTPNIVTLHQERNIGLNINRRLKFIQYRTGVWKCHRSLSPNPNPSTG